MGEVYKDALRVKVDQKLKIEFHGVKVTSDAGILAHRKLDDAFGLTDRVIKKTQIGQSIFLFGKGEIYDC
jgi:hypothetical protein